jgi:hypothetical protein
MQGEDSNGNVVLFSGDYSGHIYKQDTGTADEPGGVTTAISAFYVSANASLGSPEITKNFKYLYIFSKATTEATITLDIAYDFQDGYPDSRSLNIGSTGAVWGVGTWGSSVWPGTATQVQRIELNRSARAIRIKFSDSSSTELGVLGWAIVYDNEDYRNE